METRWCPLLFLAFAILGSGCVTDRFQWRAPKLLYPDPRGSETRMQVLFGLGLPMEGEVSMTLGYVLKCNYLLPYNSENGTGSRQNNIAAKGVSKVSRWSLYRMLEAAIDRGCLLRVICEAAALPFFRPGLLGQLLQAFLTPTMTDEEYEMYTDRQYHKAEASGRDQDCRHFYRDCPYSPLDHFTRYIDT